MESWKQIEGYSDYFVSDLGRVKSLKWGKERILKPDTDRYGYSAIALSNGKAKTHKIHRLVALAFIPNPQNHPQINHINGDKLDNRVANLQWVSPSENLKHAYSAGLKSNVSSKIYKFFNPILGTFEECTQNELITKYRLTKANVSQMIHGKRKTVKGWYLVNN